MTTLKEFEEALRQKEMTEALALLDELRQQDRARRAVAPARRVTGRRMTPELARQILDLHQTTRMTQQEIAFRLGVNQGRVNEVVKRGKWLADDPASPEAVARDRALERAARAAGKRRLKSSRRSDQRRPAGGKAPASINQPQLPLDGV